MENRRIRIFVSSTFRDMMEEREALMAQAWPELRRFCRERHVELVEVDLRWGIAEEQSTRKETLKLCLDEIRACRPFFIGLLGERYGWVPGEDAFTADLREEQPWLQELRDKSVTELEILHGVLNNPDMAGRAFFYFRDPAYVLSRGQNFQSENPDVARQQAALKARIEEICETKRIPLRVNYPDSRELAALVLADLKDAIETQYPKEAVPDPFTREAQDHEAFAEFRRRTYVGRPDYFETMDRHARGVGGPLVLFGESGCGKSALLANWLEYWRRENPRDFIFQHYIGGTSDSADHWRLMSRLIAEIKRWCDDPEELPRSHDDLLKTFAVWLAKAKIKAEREGLRFIIVLDALNQLEDKDRARLLGWLPPHPFSGPLRLVSSTLPGEALQAVETRSWESLQVQPLVPDERGRMIEAYLARFGKKLDTARLKRLSDAPGAANPLYLKILLDELRVTGTHDRLDERLGDYLSAPDIPSLLGKVLERYRRDCEHDRPGLVGEALALIWAARRGLTETEILSLVRPEKLPQLPLANWSPLRAVLDESLVDRGGILNFAHEFLRIAVEKMFVPDEDKRDEYRLRLADYFEEEPITARSCDELPWLLRETESFIRLKGCLLNIDRFAEVFTRNPEELREFWIGMGEGRDLGSHYSESFTAWRLNRPDTMTEAGSIASMLGSFLGDSGFPEAAITHFGIALEICDKTLGTFHPETLACARNLAVAFHEIGEVARAEQLYRRVLVGSQRILGEKHPDTLTCQADFAGLLHDTGRFQEAREMYRRTLDLQVQAFGFQHPDTLQCASNYSQLLGEMGDNEGSGELLGRVLKTREETLGPQHPHTLNSMNNMIGVLINRGDYEKADSMIRRASNASHRALGEEHPIAIAIMLSSSRLHFQLGNFREAETTCKRAVALNEKVLGSNHRLTLDSILNLALIYNRQANLLTQEGDYSAAEPFCRIALECIERIHGKDHPQCLVYANNLGMLLFRKGDYSDAEPILRRALVGLLQDPAQVGGKTNLSRLAINYGNLLIKMGCNPDNARDRLNELMRPFGMSVG